MKEGSYLIAHCSKLCSFLILEVDYLTQLQCHLFQDLGVPLLCF